MMKNILCLFLAVIIFACSFGQTPITNANFNQAIATCLFTNPIDGMCSDSEYGAMPDWDVSQVTNMSNAFSGRVDFNADISAWDVSNVTNMSYMFEYISVFNQDIGSWDTSNVTRMIDMFSNNSAFNQDIGNWNTSSVTNMNNMFRDNSAFNQDLSMWNVVNVIYSDYFYYNTPQWTLPKPVF